MNTTFLFVAVSLILVIAVVAIATPNTVQAVGPHKHATQYCIDKNTGAGFCYPTKDECQTAAAALTGDHKCFRSKA